jgi:hypothetical protein
MRILPYKSVNVKRWLKGLLAKSEKAGLGAGG